MKSFRELSRAERMNELCAHVNEILHRIHPDRKLTVEYFLADDTNLQLLSDWTKQRLNLFSGMEYLTITEKLSDTGTAKDYHILYAVNITMDSGLTALAELFNLMSYKF